MDRRNFLRLSSLAGLSVATPSFFGKAHAAKRSPRAGHEGTCYVFVQAHGGWDPTLLCDPKGASDLSDPKRISNYVEGDILTAGNIRYAPVGNNADFFNKHYQKTMIINGVDTKSNNHEASRRNVFSGRLGRGYPNMGAMVAGHYDPSLAMSFLSFGGYDLTHGVVPRARSGNFGSLNAIAYPRRSNASDASTVYQSDEVQALIEAAQKDREAHLRGQVHLPRAKAAMNTLFTARQGADGLRRLQEYLPTLDTSGNNLKRQAQLAMAAFRAGISISANLMLPGFDTHNDHDARHIPLMTKLLDGIDFLWEEAERQGMADRLVVVVGSDFARTPRFNSKQGKDHWSITSMMVMGAGIQGNRVIGQTDEKQGAIELAPDTLSPDPNGIRIEPKHIHQALRRFAKIDGGEMDKLFPVETENLPIF